MRSNPERKREARNLREIAYAGVPRKLKVKEIAYAAVPGAVPGNFKVKDKNVKQAYSNKRKHNVGR